MGLERCLHCGEAAGSLICDLDDCQRREAELQKARRMDVRQKRFDFNRGSKLRFLDRLVIPAHLLGKTRGAALRLVSLLRVIEGCCGERSSCWASVGTIALRMKVCERQVRRVLREAEGIGLISTINRGKRWSGQTDVREINWCLIWEWAGSPELADNKAELADNKAELADNKDRVGGLHSPPIRSNDPPERTATTNRRSEPAAGDTCARGQNSTPSSNAASEFELVVVAMRGWEPEPINGADSAVAEAKARGVTASELLQILRVAREAVCELANGTETKSIPAWGAGAIRNRVAKARPGENAAQLWPPKSDQYLKAVLTLKREQEAQAATRRNSELQALAATVQADDADRLTALESNHGHELDQLSTAALGEVIAASGDCVLIEMSRRIDPRKRGSSLRRRLLLLLEREAVSV